MKSAHLELRSCSDAPGTTSWPACRRRWRSEATPSLWSGSARTRSASGSSPPCCSSWCCPGTPAPPGCCPASPCPRCPPRRCRSAPASWDRESHPASFATGKCTGNSGRNPRNERELFRRMMRHIGLMPVILVLIQQIRPLQSTLDCPLTSYDRVERIGILTGLWPGSSLSSPTSNWISLTATKSLKFFSFYHQEYFQAASPFSSLSAVLSLRSLRRRPLLCLWMLMRLSMRLDTRRLATLT